MNALLPRAQRPSLRPWLGIALGLSLVYLAWGGPQRSGTPRAAVNAHPASRGTSSAPTSTQRAVAGVPSARAGGALGLAGSGSAVPAGAVAAVGSVVAEAHRPTLALSGAHGECPADMVFVSGEYCTEVAHTCNRWLDDDLLPYARCAEYEPPARCTGKRVAERFCIDRLEYTPPNATLPQNYASFVEASKVCEGLGKRICNESEWNFACEGPEMLPYPYGWKREAVCNQDRSDLYEPNPNRQVLKDFREPAGTRADCRSPFGVLDMTGNLDEPVLREAQRYAYPFRNGLKGGWWMAGRNRCRPATTAHDDHYRDIQVGIRCCRDAQP